MLVIGRDEAENGMLGDLAEEKDMLLEAVAYPGPTSLLRGGGAEAAVETAARITCRYGKAKDLADVEVVVKTAGGGPDRHVRVSPVSEDDIKPLVEPETAAPVSQKDEQ
jgi:hypothetical protein